MTGRFCSTRKTVSISSGTFEKMNIETHAPGTPLRNQLSGGLQMVWLKPWVRYCSSRCGTVRLMPIIEKIESPRFQSDQTRRSLHGVVMRSGT